MIEEKFQNHFFVVHTFVSEEARKEYLTPPEKRNPPQKQLTERNGQRRLQVTLQSACKHGLAMMIFFIVIGWQIQKMMFTINLKYGSWRGRL